MSPNRDESRIFIPRLDSSALGICDGGVQIVTVHAESARKNFDNPSNFGGNLSKFGEFVS
jgi:hypothetical protein